MSEQLSSNCPEQHCSGQFISECLNNSKTHEFVVFKSKRLKTSTPPRPPINGINQVQTIKILGPTLNSDLSIKEQIDNTLTSCGQSLFCIKNVKIHGMPNSTICDVYGATTLSKLLYACSAWWEFTTANDRHRLEAFIRKSQKFGYQAYLGLGLVRIKIPGTS